MKSIAILIISSIIIFSSCNMREREEALRKKEMEIKEREQELILKEKSLEIKEANLLQKEQILDSTTINDTAFVYNPVLIGLWSVKMVCKETTCPGWAIGDTKTEQWEIVYQGNKIIAKAIVDYKVVRMYSGVFKGNMLDLVDEQELANPKNKTRITVRLRITGDKTMEGQREILRIGDCRILYSLKLNKE